MDGAFLLFALFCWAACAGVGAYVAGAKGREPAEGGVLGFLLGPFGILIAALLPTRQAAAAPSRSLAKAVRDFVIVDPPKQSAPAPPRPDAATDDYRTRRDVRR